MTAIGGLVALAVGAVLMVSATANVKNTLELLNRRAALTVSMVDRGVANYVKPARSLIAHFRRMVGEGKVSLKNEAQIVTALMGSLAAAPQIAGVVFWRPDGSGIWVTRGTGGAIETSPAAMPPSPDILKYINDAKKENSINWGSPFVRDNLPVMTIGGALYQNSAFAGVIAAGLSLVEMSNFLKTFSDDDMTSFVLYGDDRVLAHPSLLDPELRALVSLEKPLLGLGDIGDPVLQGFPQAEIERLPQDSTFEFRRSGGGGVTDIILTRIVNRYGHVPWRVGVHVSSASAGQQMRRLIGSISVGLGLMAASIIAALFLATRIARPIKAISAAAGRVASLNVKDIEPLPPSRIRELDDESRAFNRMVTGLKWFETYVPRQLVLRLMEAPEGPAVGHREAELTVMFTDIIGFTSLSESMPAAKVAEFLNHHFDVVNRSIEAQGGTLDKYIGDAAMAFWGAPEPYPDHAARACRTALAILSAAEAHREEDCQPEVRVKIAIHTGPLIVGNIGAQARMNYTVIGDTVNVASRIEKLCSDEDDGAAAIIIASGETVRAAGKGFNFERLGTHTVKGRHEAIEIWRLRA